MISLIDLFRTIYFNFKYLPPTVAIKLPIYLHNVKFDDMRGSIRIESDNIRRGMITIGCGGLKCSPTLLVFGRIMVGRLYSREHAKWVPHQL